jgi:diaminohydroxyphosphoribosylaminopyrimidine deaminase/5-amino-6-(5-phosphoribosylamino)uracil reductase
VKRAAGKGGASKGGRSKRTLPEVTLKAAITLDGRIATQSGDSRWITSEASRRLAHRMRAQSDAVLVGVGTVLADNPELTVRHVRGKNPLRVVLDSRLRTPFASCVASTTNARTLIAHGPRAPLARKRALAAAGVELCELALHKDGGLDLVALLATLQARGVHKLLVEGGGRVHGALLAAGLVHNVALFIAPRLLADSFAKPLAEGPAKARIADAHALQGVRYRKLGPDLLVTGKLVAGKP